jgi:hypothetical protein
MLRLCLVLVLVTATSSFAGPEALSDQPGDAVDAGVLADADAGASSSDFSREAERLGAATASALVGGATAAPSAFVLGGYAEAFYQWNFNAPSNQLTALRGFDNRHNTFTLANVALDAQWDFEDVVGRVTLQIGHTADSYYSAEPSRAGGGGVNATSASLWKFVQQGFVGYRFKPLGRTLLVQGGLFLSPIGPEGMAVRDNWTWSRSNLFFGLPYYHTGLRATLAVTPRWAVTLAGYNGWNSVTDNNVGKSVSVQLTYAKPDVVAVSLLYFGGPERPTGALEGQPWRHLLDAHVTWTATPRLSLMAHANGGLEPNRFGLSGWVAGAVYGRYEVLKTLFLVGRLDAFFEQAAANAEGAAARLFWPVPAVGSGTLTVDFRPHPRVSARLELRHDRAAGDAFFAGAVEGDGSVTTPWLANRATQTTLTLGLTSWF